MDGVNDVVATHCKHNLIWKIYYGRGFLLDAYSFREIDVVSHVFKNFFYIFTQPRKKFRFSRGCETFEINYN